MVETEEEEEPEWELTLGGGGGGVLLFELADEPELATTAGGGAAADDWAMKVRMSVLVSVTVTVEGGRATQVVAANACAGGAMTVVIDSLPSCLPKKPRLTL